jgi:glycosyltransferase involved in cell wall biosynthesis
VTERPRRVRLVHLADYGGPYPGSFVPMLRTVLAKARAYGWSAEAVLSHAAKDRQWLPQLGEAGLPVRFLGPRPPAAARAGVAGLLEEHLGPTILHTHFTGFDLPAVQAARRHPRVFVYWHNHMSPGRSLGNRLRNMIKYAAFGRGTERMLCVAPDAVAAARRRGMPRERVRFFPNAIDTARFPLVSRERRAFARRELGLADEQVLLHFGWDWERKGGDLFLGCARVLLEEGRHITAISVGAGEECRALAQRHGIAASVRVEEPRQDVASLFAAADVFVSPSRLEGLTYAVAEALCSGIPVVASRIPGQEWIAPAEPARRLTGFDEFELAAAVRHLLDRDPDTARAEAVAGRAWVLEHMDLERWADRLLELYVEALS